MKKKRPARVPCPGCGSFKVKPAGPRHWASCTRCGARFSTRELDLFTGEPGSVRGVTLSAADTRSET